jgi:hypothetical protein
MTLRFSTGLKNKILGKTVDLVNNGTFDASVTGWSQYYATAASVTGGQSNNCVEITNNSSAQGYIAQNLTVKPGHTYLIEIYHKNGLANGFIKIGTAANDGTYESESGLNDTNWTLRRFFIVPTSDVLWITLGVDSSVASDTTKFDEVTCIWEADSIQEIFKNSKILIYSGSQPASADDAPSGTLLCEITTAGSGNFDLEFDEATSGYITKKLTATWSGTVQNTGTAGWFRLITYGDSMASSTDDCRIDGAIATSGAELVMADTALIAGAVQTISVFKLTINL